MNRERLLSCLEGWLFGFLLSFLPLACLISAFRLENAAAVWLHWDQLALWCAGLSLAVSVCVTFRLWYIPPVLLLGLGLWQWQLLAGSLEALLAEITKYYHMAYGFGILRWTSGSLPATDVTPALCLVGTLCILALTRAVCCRKSLFGALPVCLLPLCACLVVTDTVPATPWLFALLAACVLLVLTQTVRRRTGEGAKLTAMLVLPVLLGVMLLFCLIPRNGYTGQDRADALLSQLQQLTGMETDKEKGAATTVSRQEDLAGMGIRNNPHVPVMDVVVSRPRTLYLRERGYDTYDGKRWINTKHINISDWMNPDLVLDSMSVTITTRNPQPIQYVPYYGAYTNMGGAEGATGNPGRLTTYSFRVLSLAIPAGYTCESQTLPDALYLPEDVLEWAQPLAQQLTASAATADAKARQIKAYVQNSARYDLRTDRMPGDKTDFAKWFLYESDTGYCVHYATAATVLLRAAGVPAQYVTGYVVQAEEADQPTTVYRDDAHAWVEYYQPGVGWQILDSTPEEYLSDTVQSTEPSPTEPDIEFTRPSRPEVTQPTETAPVTEPVQRPNRPQAVQTTEGDSARTLLWILIAVLGFVVLVVGQWQLRLMVYRRRLQKGSPNVQAIALWSEAVRRGRALQLMLPSRLTELAQKARFSQHTLTEEELGMFRSFLKGTETQARQKPLLRRLWLRLFHAMY